MKSFKELTERLKRGPTDCVGIDVGSTATKLIRLRRSGEDITIVGAELIPPPSPEIDIPTRLRARYASLATSSNGGVAKLLTFPGTIDAAFEAQLPRSLGLADADDFRVSYRVITEGQGRSESKVLAVALPNDDADPIMQQFTSGLPAPYSLEMSPLATLTAFERGPVAANPDGAVGLIDFGTTSTALSIFNRGALVLMRRFDFGTQRVLDRVESALRVDTETAQGILADAAFDISELLLELTSPIASQFVVSRDFVERRENCSVGALYAIGGVSLSRAAMLGLEQALGTDIATWNPLAGLIEGPQAFSEQAADQRWRFAAALGAALATVEES
jgi:Tfp pilus assembly PilM family ATPase